MNLNILTTSYLKTLEIVTKNRCERNKKELNKNLKKLDTIQEVLKNRNAL